MTEEKTVIVTSPTTNKQRRAVLAGRAGSIAAGLVDRGNPLAPFEAISFNRRTGEYLRTRHQLERLALRRLKGNSRHVGRHIVDHTERKDANGAILGSRVAQRLQDIG